MNILNKIGQQAGFSLQQLCKNVKALFMNELLQAQKNFLGKTYSIINQTNLKPNVQVNQEENAGPSQNSGDSLHQYLQCIKKTEENVNLLIQNIENLDLLINYGQVIESKQIQKIIQLIDYCSPGAQRLYRRKLATIIQTIYEQQTLNKESDASKLLLLQQILLFNPSFVVQSLNKHFQLSVFQGNQRGLHSMMKILLFMTQDQQFSSQIISSLVEDKQEQPPDVMLKIAEGFPLFSQRKIINMQNFLNKIWNQLENVSQKDKKARFYFLRLVKLHRKMDIPLPKEHFIQHIQVVDPSYLAKIFKYTKLTEIDEDSLLKINELIIKQFHFSGENSYIIKYAKCLFCLNIKLAFGSRQANIMQQAVENLITSKKLMYLFKHYQYISFTLNYCQTIQKLRNIFKRIIPQNIKHLQQSCVKVQTHFLKCYVNFLNSELHQNQINEQDVLQFCNVMNSFANLYMKPSLVMKINYFYVHAKILFQDNEDLQEKLDELEIIDKLNQLERRSNLQSNTQKKIAQILKEMGYLVEENKKIRPYQVDMYINPDLIIEYNGQDHYYSHLDNTNIIYQDMVEKNKFRSKILQILGYHIVEISCFEWSILESKTKQEQYLYQKITEVEKKKLDKDLKMIKF